MGKNNFVENFIYNYFIENKCHVTKPKPHILEVTLTEEMDKKIMNRPFYWHYIDMTSQKGEPATIKFITDPTNKSSEGEWIHFGSPRFQKIVTELRTSAKFTRLFQRVSTTSRTPLYPWLIINVKIIYKGIVSKEEIFSVGLNLINGQMHTDMMEKLINEKFQKQISDYCYSLSPIIRINSGYNRMIKVFEHYINNQQHQWALLAMKRFEEEKTLIEDYFKNHLEDVDKERIIHEAMERYQPTISFEIINGGLFYLTSAYNE